MERESFMDRLIDHVIKSLCIVSQFGNGCEANMADIGALRSVSK